MASSCTISGGFLVLAGLPWLGLAILERSPAAKPSLYTLFVLLDSVTYKSSMRHPTSPHDMLHMLDLVCLAVDIIVVSSFALGWHRFVLTGSATSGISALTLLFRDLRFLRECIFLILSVPILIIAGGLFFAVGIGLGHAMIVAGFVGVALLGWILSKFAKRPSSVALILFFMATGAVIFHEGMPQPVVSTSLALLLLVLVAPLARLLLALPAIAMGETGALWVTAWRRSERNGTKLHLGLIACAGPFEIVRWGALLRMSFYAHLAESAAMLDAMRALAPFFAAWLLLEVAVVSSYLCFAYRQLGGIEAAAPDAAVASAGLPSG